MHLLIGRRKEREGVAWKEDSPSQPHTPGGSGTPTRVREVADTIDDILENADRALEKVTTDQQAVQSDVEKVVALLNQVSDMLLAVYAQTNTENARGPPS